MTENLERLIALLKTNTRSFNNLDKIKRLILSFEKDDFEAEMEIIHQYDNDGRKNTVINQIIAIYIELSVSSSKLTNQQLPTSKNQYLKIIDYLFEQAAKFDLKELKTGEYYDMDVEYSFGDDREIPLDKALEKLLKVLLKYKKYLSDNEKTLNYYNGIFLWYDDANRLYLEHADLNDPEILHKVCGFAASKAAKILLEKKELDPKRLDSKQLTAFHYFLGERGGLFCYFQNESNCVGIETKLFKLFIAKEANFEKINTENGLPFITDKTQKKLDTIPIYKVLVESNQIAKSLINDFKVGKKTTLEVEKNYENSNHITWFIRYHCRNLPSKSKKDFIDELKKMPESDLKKNFLLFLGPELCRKNEEFLNRLKPEVDILLKILESEIAIILNRKYPNSFLSLLPYTDLDRFAKTYLDNEVDKKNWESTLESYENPEFSIFKTTSLISSILTVEGEKKDKLIDVFLETTHIKDKDGKPIIDVFLDSLEMDSEQLTNKYKQKLKQFKENFNNPEKRLKKIDSQNQEVAILQLQFTELRKQLEEKESNSELEYKQNNKITNYFQTTLKRKAEKEIGYTTKR